MNQQQQPQLSIRVPTPVESVNYNAIHISSVDTPLPRPVALSPYPGGSTTFDRSSSTQSASAFMSYPSNHQRHNEQQQQQDEDEEYDDDEDEEDGESEYEDEEDDEGDADENDDDEGEEYDEDDDEEEEDGGDGDIFDGADAYQPFGFYPHHHQHPHPYHHQYHQYHQQQQHGAIAVSSVIDDEDQIEYWGNMRAISPPLRSENPICSDDRFYSSTPVSMGAWRSNSAHGVELGIFNFSPPIHWTMMMNWMSMTLL